MQTLKTASDNELRVYTHSSSIMAGIRLSTLVLCALLIAGCSLKPIPAADLSEDRVNDVRAALASFRADQRLAPFFAEAEVVAVYPLNVRGASAFGGAYGRGLVFDKADRVIAHSRMWQISAGAQLGGQIYRQILFFRSREVYEGYVDTPAEFAGQVNAAVATFGVASTPSFHSDIALFTQLRGGLLLEASVGSHSYDFAPIGEIDSGR